jgi:hypothetical protein
LLQDGVGNLLRDAGLELMHLVMDEEGKSLADKRNTQYKQRRALRGKEDGYCAVDGQKCFAELLTPVYHGESGVRTPRELNRTIWPLGKISRG